jgi:D-alanyl-D-alanine carboxypeptidase
VPAISLSLPRRFANLLLAVMLFWAAMVGAASAQSSSGLGRYDGPNITIDVGSGRVLSANRAFDSWYPASTTKLMTAYVVFQAVRLGRVTLTSPVTISASAAAQPPSRSGLPVGSVLTVETALRVLMVKSANDIAVALGEAVAGSEAAFVRQMNEAARALGMTRSTFTNPHGLPSREQVTTAYDLGLLTMGLLRDFPERTDFYSMGAVSLGNSTWVNSNLLLQRYRGAFGFKTGYICDSGFNLIAGAQRGGRTLITVVLGARSGLERAAATAHLLDEGFRQSGGLFNSTGGTSLASFRPSGPVRTEATRLRPIVCQSPRVRPSLQEIAAQFGTAAPAFNPTRGTGANALAGDASSIVLPGNADDAGENDGADQENVLDLLLGPIIRAPQPVRLALGGATGPAAIRTGRWLVPSPVPHPGAELAALRPSTALAGQVQSATLSGTQTALPGQIAAQASGPAIVLQPPSAAPATRPGEVASSAPGAILATVGRAVDRPVPSPVPRPN